jgi:hypothetical protein
MPIPQRDEDLAFQILERQLNAMQADYERTIAAGGAIVAPAMPEEVGYSLLSMEVPDDDDSTGEDEDEEESADDSLQEGYLPLTAESSPPPSFGSEEAAADTGAADTSENSQREIAEPLSADKLSRIQEKMTSMKLKPESIPPWASEMSEEEWRSRIQNLTG